MSTSHEEHQSESHHEHDHGTAGLDYGRHDLHEPIPVTELADMAHPAHEHDDGALMSGHAHESKHESEIAVEGNGLASHAATLATPAGARSVGDGAAVTEARGLLEGIAESLRTLAGREGTDGAAVAIFPRGVDLLEVRMHVARDQAIDLNFRVAGPAQASVAG